MIILIEDITKEIIERINGINHEYFFFFSTFFPLNTIPKNFQIFQYHIHRLFEESHFEGDFLIVRNRKRKSGKIEYKKIPVSKMIRDKIDFNKPLNPTISWDRLSRKFKKIFGDENMKLYSLRHTFCTTCQMFVRQEIVDIWMGDAPDRLIGKHYTHFPDEFMLAEMDKVIFEV